MRKDTEQQQAKPRRISPEFAEVLHMLASLEKTVPAPQNVAVKN